MVWKRIIHPSTQGAHLIHKSHLVSASYSTIVHIQFAGYPPNSDPRNFLCLLYTGGRNLGRITYAKNNNKTEHTHLQQLRRNLPLSA